jgi:DNA-binding transcriptional regulator LsrR (DeoR family)
MKQKEKQEWAKTLYLSENLTQQEISDKIGVSRNTINRWIKNGKWEDLKTSFTVTREQQLQRLYLQIAEINKVIAGRERKYPDSKEADMISKLAVAIDKLERESSLSDIISVSVKMLNWVRKYDLEKAKELSGLFDAFIKEQIR